MAARETHRLPKIPSVERSGDREAVMTKITWPAERDAAPAK